MFPVGYILNETYRIEGLLGQGGTASVFLVSHVRLPRQFALKVITAAHCTSEFLQRFRQEAEILASINHPHLVNVVDWNLTPSGQPYLVMELLVGADLAHFLNRIGPLSPSLALQIFMQIADALQTAHERGIIHRDLKPANIFLCSNGPFPYFAKVLDFGIAKSVKIPSKLQTDRSVIMGTPAYMAPEQASGDGEQVDARTDQFALATILYEMIAGRPAFYRAGDHLLATILRVVTEEPEPLDEPQINAAVRRAMSKQREHRFANLAQFIEATGAHKYSTAMAVLDRTARVTSKPSVPELNPELLVEELAAEPQTDSAAGFAAKLPPLAAPPVPAALAAALLPIRPRLVQLPWRWLRLGLVAAIIIQLSVCAPDSLPDPSLDGNLETLDAGTPRDAAPDGLEGADAADAEPQVIEEAVSDCAIADAADLWPPEPPDLTAPRRAFHPRPSTRTVRSCTFNAYSADGLRSEIAAAIYTCFIGHEQKLRRYVGKDVELSRSGSLTVVSGWVPSAISEQLNFCLEKLPHDAIPQSVLVNIREIR